MRLHLIGPFPPPLGGATITFQVFVDDIVGRREDLGIDAVTWSDLSPPARRSKHTVDPRYLFHVCRQWGGVARATWSADGVICFSSERWFWFLAPLLLV